MINPGLFKTRPVLRTFPRLQDQAQETVTRHDQGQFRFVLAPKDGGVNKILTATTHVGSTSVNTQTESYVFKCRPDVINLGRTWEQLLLVARCIASSKYPGEVFAISSRQFGQRAVLKFVHHIDATLIAGSFTPGVFKNLFQPAFREPRLLTVTDPLADHQPVTKTFVNIPGIAFSNTDSPLKFVDIAIGLACEAFFYLVPEEQGALLKTGPAAKEMFNRRLQCQ